MTADARRAAFDLMTLAVVAFDLFQYGLTQSDLATFDLVALVLIEYDPVSHLAPESLSHAFGGTKVALHLNGRAAFDPGSMPFVLR